MKKIFTLAFLFFLAWNTPLSAQFFDSCSVVVIVDPSGGLTAVPDGEPPFMFEWATGDTAQTIFPNTPGNYCVTVTDAAGCMVTGCAQTGGGGSLLTCSINMLYDSTSTFILQAVGFGGELPYTFLWSNGSTQQSIIGYSPETYWVVITDASGQSCTSIITLPPAGCSVTIEEAPALNGITAVVDIDPDSVSFTWNTGETGQVSQPPTTGTYCVWAAFPDGCVAYACYFYDGGPVLVFDEIQGFVFAGDSTTVTPLEGVAYLIGFDPAAGTLTALDTVALTYSFNIPYYNFGPVPAGYYLVKVALNEGSNGYENFLPTYYGNVLYWYEATSVTPPFNNWFPSFDITLIPGVNPGGPGFIGGLVSEGANFQAGGEERGEGDPLGGVEVLLLDEMGGPVAFDWTGTDGKFTFPDLAWGAYQLRVEIPGLESAVKWITIGPDNPTVGNIEFIVGSDQVTTGVAEKMLVREMSLQPNPAREFVTIQLFSDNAYPAAISLYDLNGRSLLQEIRQVSPGENWLEIPLQGLQPGIYLVRVLDQVEKLIIH